MLNFSNLMIGTHQPKVMADFYKQVFDKEPDMADESFSGWQVGNCFFNVGEHSEVNGHSKEPQRIMINLETDDVKGEFERIKNISGAVVIKEPYTIEGWENNWIATFADPDGNYFQLMTPWEPENGGTEN